MVWRACFPAKEEAEFVETEAARHLTQKGAAELPKVEDERSVTESFKSIELNGYSE